MERMDALLRRVQRRMLVHRTLSAFSRALFWGGLAGAGWVLLTRLLPQAGDPAPVLAVLLIAAACWAAARAYVNRPSLAEAAGETDARFELRERLLSSWRLRDVAHPMVDALHRDALDHLPVSVKEQFPTIPLRDLRRAGPAVALLAIALVIPEIDVLGYRDRVEAAAKLQEARRLRAEAVRESATPLRRLAEVNPDSDMESLIQEIERIAERVESGDISEKQAAAQMTQIARTLAGDTPQTSLEQPRPRSASEAAPQDAMKALARALEQGDLSKAAEELRALQEQLREEAEKAEGGEGVDQERLQEIAERLQEMSQALGGDATELGARLAEMASQLSVADMAQVAEALSQCEGGLCDLAAVLDQMNLTSESLGAMQDALDGLLGERGQWGDLVQGELRALELERLRQLAQCEGCRGVAPGAGEGMGPGMGGAGRGTGGRIGELPDVASGLDPTMLPGEMTAGKILAGIMQRSAPDDREETPTVEMTGEILVRMRQEAERAMTREEIPPGARELVRGYFGSLESAADAPASQTP